VPGLGGITGAEIAAAPGLPAALRFRRAARERQDHLRDLLSRDGKEILYALRRALRTTMDQRVGVFRTSEDLAAGLDAVRALRQRSLAAPVQDKGTVYNSNLFHALELENLLDLAEVTIMGALAREESRGAHARRDFATRDDQKWLKHTLAWRTDGVPRLDYKPVTIDTWQPVERKY
jgi:succinate dehydrogenase / fumarate reductase flavoprotein subunit